MNDLASSTEPANEWMTVYITYNESEAHIVAGRLKYEGIQALVHRAIGGSAIGITIGSLGEVRVLVHPPDYDAAMAIIEPAAHDELPEQTGGVTFIWNDPEYIGDDEFEVDDDDE